MVVEMFQRICQKHGTARIQSHRSQRRIKMGTVTDIRFAFWELFVIAFNSQDCLDHNCVGCDHCGCSVVIHFVAIEFGDANNHCNWKHTFSHFECVFPVGSHLQHECHFSKNRTEFGEKHDATKRRNTRTPFEIVSVCNAFPGCRRAFERGVRFIAQYFAN